ncbi:MAG: WD40 repeat domain-containing protein [bacterium]|nr:WD40 repeat domain-containing protein [bacterium]
MKKLWLLGVLALLLSIGTTTPTTAQLSDNPVITSENVTQIVQLGILGHDKVREAIFSPDGNTLIIVIQNNILLYDVNNLDKEPQSLFVQDITTIDYSPDGQSIVAGFRNGAVHILDVDTVETKQAFHEDIEPISVVAYSPNGGFIGTGSNEGTVRVLDISTNTELYYQIGVRFTPVTALKFSPDGKSLAFGYWRGNDIYIFDVQTGTRQHHFIQNTLGIWNIVYSPDGKFITSTTNNNRLEPIEINIWDIEQELLVQSFEGHTSAIIDIDYSPDGQLIVSGSIDQTLRIWDVAIGIELRTLIGHSDIVSNVDFSPDGRFIVSGSSDGTIRIWGIPQN